MTEPTLRQILEAGATRPELAAEAFKKALDEYDETTAHREAYAQYEEAVRALRPRPLNSQDPRVLALRQRYGVGGV